MCDDHSSDIEWCSTEPARQPAARAETRRVRSPIEDSEQSGPGGRIPRRCLFHDAEYEIEVLGGGRQAVAHEVRVVEAHKSSVIASEIAARLDSDGLPPIVCCH